jgi:hypothetical protein
MSGFLRAEALIKVQLYEEAIFVFEETLGLQIPAAAGTVAFLCASLQKVNLLTRPLLLHTFRSLHLLSAFALLSSPASTQPFVLIFFISF